MAPAIETALVVCGVLAAAVLVIVGGVLISDWATTSGTPPAMWVSIAVPLGILVGVVARRLLARRRARHLAEARGRRELDLTHIR